MFEGGSGSPQLEDPRLNSRLGVSDDSFDLKANSLRPHVGQTLWILGLRCIIENVPVIVPSIIMFSPVFNSRDVIHYDLPFIKMMNHFISSLDLSDLDVMLSVVVYKALIRE